MNDFLPPPKRGNDIEKLFTTKAHRRVQPPAESHEYKKVKWFVRRRHDLRHHQGVTPVLITSGARPRGRVPALLEAL
ncbi:hypothetical protein [Streptomyces sp. WAC 06725]|uniref:hypothetical protein n=1 Tax=Streptomyces sp. WAC 06725 TaxID=2203209 RepID=UPI00163D1B99|nr:hypothetical protein [Streptomyces sp. WAC 06725]